MSTHYQKDVGDTVISVKYKLQRKNDNVGGIALKGFVKLPTAIETQKSAREDRRGTELLFSSLLPGKFLMHSSLEYARLQMPNGR